MARRFGKVVSKPSKANAKWLEASYATPVEAFGRYPGLPGRQVKTFPVGGEDDARAWLNKIKKRIEAGVWEPERAVRRAEIASRVTFGEYWPEWLRNRRTRTGQPIADTTRYRLEKDIRLHVAPYFDAMRMVDVDDATVDEWLDWLPADQKAMRMNAWKTAHAIFRSASMPGAHGTPALIDSNPFDRRRVERPRKRKVTVIATPQEIKTIYDAMPERYADSVLLACFIELRIGEVCALRRGSVNLDAGTIRIDRSRKTAGDEIVGRPKTESSVADQIIPPQLTPMLRRLMERIPDDPDAWLFPSVKDTTKPLHPNTLRGWYDDARRKAGRPDLWFHELRATGLTWTAQDGATLKETMEAGRHTDAKSAMIYQHAAAGRRLELAEKLGERLLPDDTPEIVRERIKQLDAKIEKLQQERKEQEEKLRMME